MTDLVERFLRNYHLTRLIGSGPRAEVYQGTHHFLKTSVAIKILHADADSQLLNRFLIAAGQFSQLTHPHILHVFDVGMKDHLPYLVMDYAPGGNIRQFHPSGTIVPLPTVVSYVTALASALQYAHEHNCIHGNLKPENVLQESHYGLLLSDFGLTPLSSMREYLGSLTYLAPELLHQQASPASDQYALTVMIYEWLSGQPLFEATAALQGEQHLVFTPPLSLRERCPELAPAVEQVLLKALSREPAQRYPDVLSFASAFEAAAGRTVSHSLVIARATPPEPEEATMRTSPHPAWNLPVPLLNLIGREQDLQVVHARLSRPEVRLLTLIGPPGIGKTRLALELGARVLGEFAQGLCFVPLVPIRDPELVIPTIAHTLGLREEDTSPLLERLKAFLGERQLLLVLDNFEQVLPAAPQLAEVLSTCPHLKLLVTSRASLHLQGEYEFTVPPLSVPDLKTLPSLDTLAQVASVALFVQRVEAVKPDFQLTESNAVPIARICAHLEGVPLAIELAAARSKLLSFQGLLSRLKQGSALLSSGRQDVVNHQQTLYATIGWSYDLLSREEQALLRRLCIFVGTFTLEAAEAVARTAGDLPLPVLEGVGSLVDKSLLQLHGEDGQEPQFHLLELIREFGLERLKACGELEGCHAAHAAYYLALSEQAEKTLSSSPQEHWLARLEQEHENIRAALQWLLAERDAETATRIALALRQFWFLAGHLSEGRRLLAQILEAFREDDVRLLRARALFAAGYLAFRQHDPKAALASFEESLALFQHLDDPHGIADCQRILGVVRYILGEVEQGLKAAKESLSLYQQLGDTKNSADVLLDLGIETLFRGAYDQARQQLEESQVLFLSMGEAWGQGAALHYLGFTAYAQEQYTQAKGHFEESLALLRRLGRPYATSEVMTIFACDLVALGEQTRARTLLEEALTLAREKENTEDVARVLCGSGHLALRQGHLTEARACFEDGVAEMQGRWLVPRSKWVVASCLEGLGELALQEGQARLTVQLFAVAQTVRTANGYSCLVGIGQPFYERALAEVRKQLGEQDFAAAWAAGQAMTPEQALQIDAPIPQSEAVSSSQPTKLRPTEKFPSGLTAREIEVLHLLAKGFTNNQIAEQLILSVYTVNRHVQSIYGKLAVNSRSGATRYAMEHQLF